MKNQTTKKEHKDESKKPTIGVLIPCHNEEKMIEQCIESVLSQIRPADKIIVVDDGSRDESPEIVARYADRITIITNPEPSGNKSLAQEIGIKEMDCDYFVATDGDTILDKDFIRYVEEVIETNEDVKAISGYVKSMRHNYLTALREIDYTIGQDLYKRAQSVLGHLLVIPGCAGVFKTELFKDVLAFDHDTLTEDLDMTYKLHEQKIRIYFEPRAVSYTQDPPTIHSYANQMRRWHGGGWQNLMKHYSVTKYPHSALLLSLLYLEGLVASVLLFVFLLVNPVLFALAAVPFMFFAVGLGAYTAYRRKRLDVLMYSPLLVFLGFINGYIFLERFVVEVLLGRKNMKWFQPERTKTTITQS